MRKGRPIAFSLCLALGMVSVMARTTQAQVVVVAGSGTGGLESTTAGPQNNGAVAWASCAFDQAAQTATCSSRVYNIVDLIAAHIHIGGPGTSGAVIIPIPNLPLRTSGSWGQTWTWSATDMNPNPAAGINSFDNLLQACVAGGCYLNWHTTARLGRRRARQPLPGEPCRQHHQRRRGLHSTGSVAVADAAAQNLQAEAGPARPRRL